MADDIILGNIKINNETGKTIAQIKESMSDLGQVAAVTFTASAKASGKLVETAKLLTAEFNGLEVPLIKLPGAVKDITEVVEELQYAAHDLELGFREGTIEASLADLARFKGEVDTVVRSLSAATGIEQDIKKKQENEKAAIEKRKKDAADFAQKMKVSRDKDSAEAQKAADALKKKTEQQAEEMLQIEVKAAARRTKNRRLRNARRKRDADNIKKNADKEREQIKKQRRLLDAQLKRVEKINKEKKQLRAQEIRGFQDILNAQKSAWKEANDLRQRELNAIKGQTELKKRQFVKRRRLLGDQVKRVEKIQKDARKELERKEKKSYARQKQLGEKFIRGQFSLLRFANKMLFTTRIVAAPFISAMVRAGTAIADVGGFAIKSSIKFEAFELQLRALNKSAINTAKEFQNIKTFAAESPLSTDEVVESFIKLKAVGVKQALETTKTLGQIGLVFNRDLRDVTSSFISLEARTLRRLGIVINRSTSKAILESGNLIRVVDNNVNAIRDAILDIFKKKAPQAFKIFTSSVQAQLKVLLSFMEIFGADLGDKLFRKPLAEALVAINAFVRNNSETLVGAITQIFQETDKFESNLKKISRKIDELFSEEGSEKLKENLVNSLSSALSASIGVVLSLGTTLTITLGRSIFNAFDFASKELDRRGGLWNVLRGEGTEPFEIASIDGATKTKLEENFKKLKKIRADAARTSGYSVELDDLFGGGLIGTTPGPIQSALNSLNDSEESKDALSRLKGKLEKPFQETQETIAEFNKLTEGLDRLAVLSTLEQRVTIERSIKETKQTFFEGFVDLVKNGKAASDEIKKSLELAFGVIPKGASEAAKKMFTKSPFKKARKALELIQKLKLDAKEKNIKLSEIIIQDEAKQINEARQAVEKTLKLKEKELGAEQKILDMQERIQRLRGKIEDLRPFKNSQMAKKARINALKEIFKLKRQIPKEFKEMGEGTRKVLEKQITDLQGLLKKLTAGELGEATKADTPQQKAQKILDEVGDTFFIGRSLGSKILDEAFLEDDGFQERLKAFYKRAADAIDLAGFGLTQKGMRDLFQTYLREDLKGAEQVFDTLAEGAFENVPASGLLGRLQKTTGFLTNLLRKEIRALGEVSVTAKAKITDMLSTTAGQNKLAKQLLNSSKILKETNAELEKTGGFFDHLGKKTALSFKQGGLEEQYIKFAKRMSTVKKQVATGFQSFMGPQGFELFAPLAIFEDAFDEKKYRDLLTNTERNFLPFANEIEGQATKIKKIDLFLQQTDFVPSVKSRLREVLKKSSAEGVFTDANAELEKIKGEITILEQGSSGIFLGFERFFTKLKTDGVTMAQGIETALNGVANSIGSNLTTALTSLAQGTESVEEAFTKMAENLIQDLIRLAIQLLITAAAAAILSVLLPGAPQAASAAVEATAAAANLAGGSLGGGGIFPQADGGVMKGSMGPVHKYAQGGIARSPQVAVFGEGQGAEAFVPLPDGRTIPVSMSGGGGGGTQNVSVNFNVSAIDQRGVAGFLMDNQRDITLTVINAINSNRSFRSAI